MTPQTPPTDRPLTAGDVLWMVHILGPDDVIPAPDHRSAVDQCADINRAMPDLDDSVLCVAVPALWMGSREAHEEGLKSIVETWDTHAHTAPGVALSASDRACYEYPDAHDGPLRAAYVAGAEAYSTRPATSAASEVEGPCCQPRQNGSAGLLALTSQVRDMISERNRPLGPDVWPSHVKASVLASLDAIDAAVSGAALASPPVSERERELEGALREIEAMCPATCETSLANDMAQIAHQALAAQPAGEGK